LGEGDGAEVEPQIAHRTAAGSAAGWAHVGAHDSRALARDRMASPKGRRLVEGVEPWTFCAVADGLAIGAPFGNDSENPQESARIEEYSAQGPSGRRTAPLQAKSGVQRRIRFFLPCRRSWVRVPSAASLNSLQTSTFLGSHHLAAAGCGSLFRGSFGIAGGRGMLGVQERARAPETATQSANAVGKIVRTCVRFVCCCDTIPRGPRNGSARRGACGRR
jgi:hypothetical protein